MHWKGVNRIIVAESACLQLRRSTFKGPLDLAYRLEHLSERIAMNLALRCGEGTKGAVFPDGAPSSDLVVWPSNRPWRLNFNWGTR